MGRPRKEPLEILERIIRQRQPMTLRDVRYFAYSYVATGEMSKDELYDLIRANFSVEVNDAGREIVTIKEEVLNEAD